MLNLSALFLLEFDLNSGFVKIGQCPRVSGDDTQTGVEKEWSQVLNILPRSSSSYISPPQHISYAVLRFRFRDLW
jgi:hypothetical protein